jgi:hypothetical protein
VLKVPRDARPGIGDSWRSRGRSPERPFRGLPVIARCLEAVIVRSGQRFADLAAPAHIKSRRVCVWAYRYRSPRYWSLSRGFDRGVASFIRAEVEILLLDHLVVIGAIGEVWREGSPSSRADASSGRWRRWHGRNIYHHVSRSFSNIVGAR